MTGAEYDALTEGTQLVWCRWDQPPLLVSSMPGQGCVEFDAPNEGVVIPWRTVRLSPSTTTAPRLIDLCLPTANELLTLGTWDT